MEPRLLLSADLAYTAVGSADLTLRVADVAGVYTLQLVERTNPASVVASESLAHTDGSSGFGARIDAGGFDLKLRIDDSVLAAHVAGGIVVLGGAGQDTLFGPDADSVWNITGSGEGNLGDVRFSGIENLSGAAGNEDTFVFLEAGALSGLVDGGAGGFDTLVLDGGSFDAVDYAATGPNSGTIARDGVVLSYDGLEPILDNLNVANRVITTSNFDDRATLSGGAMLTLAPGCRIPDLRVDHLRRAERQPDDQPRR